MSPQEAEVVLRMVFNEFCRNRFGDDVKVPPNALAQARKAYALVDDAHKRRAYHGFANKGVLLSDTPPPAMQVVFVLGDNEPDSIRVVGFSNGATWNGWAVPLVEHDAAREFCTAMKRWQDQTYTWDEEHDRIVQTDSAYPDDPPCIAEAFWYESADRNLFDLGGTFGLCWTIDEERTRALDDLRALIGEIGAGFHLDTKGADYEPPVADAARVDAIVAHAMTALSFTDPYAVALDMMRDLGLID